MPTYNYNNGNYSSTTNIVNGVAYTQNVTMLGGTGGGCGDSTTCPQGYSLYFPCMTNVFRGTDVCFDFYIADNANQDTVDLRDVDALSINISGRFGCALGNFSYPSDDNYITPLQTQKYDSVVSEDFTNRKIYDLSVSSIDTNMDDVNEINVVGSIGEYYENDNVKLIADDTPNYIFVGWVDFDSEYEDDCNGYISNDKEITINMYSDRNIGVVYRKRDLYTINFDTTKNVIYNYYYNGVEKELSNVDKFKEGSHVVVRAKPIGGSFKSWYDGDTVIVKQLVMDGNKDISIIFKGANETKNENVDNFFGMRISSLLSKLGSSYVVDDFKTNEPQTHNINKSLEYNKKYDITKRFSEMDLLNYENVSCYFEGNNCLLGLGNKNGDGFIEISNPGLKNKTIVQIVCREYNNVDCSISVKLDNGTEEIKELYSSSNHTLTFEFDKVDFNKIRIETIGEIKINGYKSSSCLIDKIVILDEIIVDKGKCSLCLPASITSNFHVGQLTATGAININGKTYGLSCSTIGSVNNSPIINTI